MDKINVLEESSLLEGVTVIHIIIAVVTVLITIIIFLCRGSANKRSGVLLVGLCDSGKTLLYSRLVNNRYVDTQTSVKENSGIYQFREKKSAKLRIIDLPGYERLRNIFLDQYKSLARGIIFVVDSSTITKDVKEVGELLYHLLTDNEIGSNSPPLLIACNKQDQTLAKGATVIKNLLEKELDTVRKTQAAALEGTSELHKNNNNIYLGHRNKQFEFSDLKPLRVEFAECSLHSSMGSDDTVNMQDVVNWLSKIA